MAANPIQSQNLIKQVSLDELRRPPGFWSALILDTAAVITAVLAGYFFKGYLDGRSLVWPVILFGLFCLFFFFGALLEKSFLRRLLVSFLAAAALVGGAEFISPLPENSFLPSWEILGAAFAVFAVCLVWGEIVVKRELENSLNIRFFRLSGSEFGKIMTGAAFVAMVMYIPYWRTEDMFFSRGSFMKIFDAAAGFANNFYPEVDFTAPIGEVAERLSEVQLKKNPVFANLPPASRRDALRQFTDRFIAEISQSSGMEISAEETPGAVAYDFLLNFLKKWEGQLQGVFLAIWAVGMFFLLKAAGAILAFILEFLAFFFYHTLLTFGVAHVVYENVRKESAELLK